MKSIPLFVSLLLAFIVLAAPPAHASTPDASSSAGTSPETGLPPDGLPRPLAPATTLWYQFTYDGDRSPIEIRLLDGGAPDIHLAVYTPDQVQRWRSGDDLKPIGQAARSGGAPDVSLHWAGSFNNGGSYYVAVQNPSELAYTIRVVALGRSVQFPQIVVESEGDAGSHGPPAANAAHPAAQAPGAVVGAHGRVAAIAPSSAAPLPPSLVATTVPVFLPDYVGIPPVSIPLTARPAACTPPSAMPAAVARSIALCPGQLYAPIRVTGSNLTLFGDPTAMVQGAPRGFGVTVTGNNVTIAGVRVAASTHPADGGTWLCLFQACSYDTIYQKGTVHGGIGYGGGILLEGANANVLDSTVWGGTIGIAAVSSARTRLIRNNLSNLNGWGVYLQFTAGAYVVGNTLNDVNRGCVGPDGFYYGAGCESAALACVGCQDSLIVSNTCARAANCYYATGDGGLPSNDNHFYDNRCAGASNNCFEVTFSQGNRFDYNIAGPDEATGQQCSYPFWIAGSIVQFGKHNDWACSRPSHRAQEDSQNSTNQPTEIRGL